MKKPTMSKRFHLKHLWPRSLTAQLVCLSLGAIILTHIVLGILLAEERRDALELERRGGALARVASISRILSTTPHDTWGDVLRVAQSPHIRLRLVDETQVIGGREPLPDRIRSRLDEFLAITPGTPARMDILSEDACQAEKRRLREARKAWRETKGNGQTTSVGPGDSHHHRAPWELSYLDRFNCAGDPVLHLAVPISLSMAPVIDGDVITGDDASPNNGPGNSMQGGETENGAQGVQSAPGGQQDGQYVWLEAAIGGITPPPWFVWENFLRVILSAAVIGIITFFLARRISRSWSILAQAADRVGRGDYPDPVPEKGPREIERAARAFNQMTERLKRFVDDRTRMLAAISHDLRTPITSLRLRAEFIDDAENRSRIIETLNEMEQMVEAAMTFAREETASEETRKIDLAALIESAVEDLTETGRPIKFIGEVDARVYPCRPLSIKRAFGNLVSNALTFGDTVEVALRDADDGGLWIEIADDGPGIPADQRAQVFEPFFRIEESRNRDTGGIGLGMAIARTAIRAHGGEIYLEESQKGGLLARIYLPRVTG
ncbi:HAMP domain-containing protein [Thalassospira sp. MA62]|nr:HAMP domain-containing protein [Thalassospira sp. MA62]